MDVPNVEYRIVYTQSIDSLQRRINDLIGEGWEIAGGVAVAYDTNEEGTPALLQAMIKAPYKEMQERDVEMLRRGSRFNRFKE